MSATTSKRKLPPEDVQVDTTCTSLSASSLRCLKRQRLELRPVVHKPKPRLPPPPMHLKLLQPPVHTSSTPTPVTATPKPSAQPLTTTISPMPMAPKPPIHLPPSLHSSLTHHKSTHELETEAFAAAKQKQKRDSDKVRFAQSVMVRSPHDLQRSVRVIRSENDVATLPPEYYPKYQTEMAWLRQMRAFVKQTAVAKSPNCGTMSVTSSASSMPMSSAVSCDSAAANLLPGAARFQKNASALVNELAQRYQTTLEMKRDFVQFAAENVVHASDHFGFGDSSVDADSGAAAVGCVGRRVPVPIADSLTRVTAVFGILKTPRTLGTLHMRIQPKTSATFPFQTAATITQPTAIGQMATGSQIAVGSEFQSQIAPQPTDAQMTCESAKKVEDEINECFVSHCELLTGPYISHSLHFAIDAHGSNLIKSKDMNRLVCESLLDCILFGEFHGDYFMKHPPTTAAPTTIPRFPFHSSTTLSMAALSNAMIILVRNHMFWALKQVEFETYGTTQVAECRLVKMEHIDFLTSLHCKQTSSGRDIGLTTDAWLDSVNCDGTGEHRHTVSSSRKGVQLLRKLGWDGFSPLLSGRRRFGFGERGLCGMRASAERSSLENEKVRELSQMCQRGIGRAKAAAGGVRPGLGFEVKDRFVRKFTDDANQLEFDPVLFRNAITALFDKFRHDSRFASVGFMQFDCDVNFDRRQIVQSLCRKMKLSSKLLTSSSAAFKGNSLVVFKMGVDLLHS